MKTATCQSSGKVAISKRVKSSESREVFPERVVGNFHYKRKTSAVMRDETGRWAAENKQTIIDVIEQRTNVLPSPSTAFFFLSSMRGVSPLKAKEKKKFVVVLVSAGKHTECVKSCIVLLARREAKFRRPAISFVVDVTVNAR